MSTNTAPLDPPPPYHAAPTNPTWPPTILILAGQSIHTSTATATSPPLYRLNRGITSLTHSTTAVELSRVERTVRVNHDNDYGVGETEPTVRVRARDIYTLRHTHTRTAALTGGRLEGDSPSYYIEAVSRRRRGTGFGDLGIRKAHRFWSSRWAVLPMRRSRSSNSSSFDLARFVEGGRRPPPVFEIRRRWKDRTHWWWFDGDGNAVAVQDDDCEGGQHHRLVVSASLPCYTMDALVALWCCRLWEESAERAGRVHEGMEGVRRKFRLAREVRPRFGPAFWP